MAQRKSPAQPGHALYEERQRRRTLQRRRQKALFIPWMLKEATRDADVDEVGQTNAHAIAIQWADLETGGHLPQYKESSVANRFLDELFCRGFGYQLKTDSPESFQLDHQFHVPQVGQADAAIGDFPKRSSPIAMIELKGAGVDLDRSPSERGRTPSQQIWDYLNAMPDCPWGILSNFSLIRLYHREKGSLAFEEFSLQELRNRQRFNEFYCIFERRGLLPSKLAKDPRALALLLRTISRQKEVGDKLYDAYQNQRLTLIDHLNARMGKSLDTAIRIAQKLLDRIIFIAFCEDRELLNKFCLERAWTEIPPFRKVTNPRWHSFLALFEEVDRGGESAGTPKGFNGNLFKPDPDVDNLDLEDEWTDAFKHFGDYDFSDEVNVDVLGHLFERSVTELEKLRVGGRDALMAGAEELRDRVRQRLVGVRPNGNGRQKKNGLKSKMPKSAQRKRLGIYYTPPAFTGLIVERTVDVVVRERFDQLKTKHAIDPLDAEQQDSKKLLGYWAGCLESLKAITVCDPACGSGAFLIRAYDALDAHYKIVVNGLAAAGMNLNEVDEIEDAIPDLILTHNIYGVDLSHEAVEITQLALWIRSARRGKTLADLSKHIVCGNSLVSDAAVDPKALDWHKTFPHIFKKDGGFTCVIGNPPWERLKVQEREFFSLTDPEIAQAVSAADRRKRIAEMVSGNAPLHAAYLEAQGKAQKTLDYARKSGRYPLTGKGDVNTYMLFAELARIIVAPDGLVGLLLPSGIATDDTTKEYFNDIMDSKRLVSLYDFENKEGIFEDVHRSYKFSAMVLCGSARTHGQADFVFFAHTVEETTEINKQRHIPLTAADMKLFNPNTRTCPILRTRRDAQITKVIYKRVPILIDENRKKGGNPWGIKFLRMFDQTNDAEHFQPQKYWEKHKYKLQGNVFVSGKKRALPLYEAKMVQAYDHRAASVVIEGDNWMRQGQKEETSLVEHQNPEFAIMPRWWVDASNVDAVVNIVKRDWLFTFKDVTSATNERTMIASFLPWAAVLNSAPLLFFEEMQPRRECCLLANLNSSAYDYVARQKVGSVHLNFFIVEQIPTFPPERYSEKFPWTKRQSLERWISERVLKLSCTAEDMIPLAKACDFKGSRGDGVHIWNETERFDLRSQLDAAYFHLYGIERDDVEYILSTFTNTGFRKEDDRGSHGSFWKPNSMGEMIMHYYDEYAGD